MLWHTLKEGNLFARNKVILFDLDAKGYNVTKMFRLAEQFFKDLGLPEMTTSFWTKSLFTKPTDGRRVVCHAAAWDFLDHDDFRSVK